MVSCDSRHKQCRTDALTLMGIPVQWKPTGKRARLPNMRLMKSESFCRKGMQCFKGASLVAGCEFNLSRIWVLLPELELQSDKNIPWKQ